MERTTRRFAATLAATVAVLTATACTGGGSGPSPEESAAAAQGGTLNFYSDKAAWEPQLTELSTSSKQATNIDLKINGYSDANAYSAFIKQSFRTKESPGAFSWHTGTEMADLVENGLLAETTDLWAKGIADGNLPEDLKQSYTVNGKQYCAPMNVAYWVMFYNKEIFAANNLDEPTTWTDMMAAADKLKQAGVTPFYQTEALFNFVWFQTLVAGTDLELYKGLSTGEVAYTDPRVVAIMEQWKDMMAKGYFNKPGVTTEPATMLQNGDVAMLPFGTFVTANLNSLKMKMGTDYGAFLIPAVTDGATTPVAVESAPICTAEKSTQKALGLRWLEWSTTPEAQSTWAKSSGQVSYNPKAEPPNAELGTFNDKVTADDVQLYDRYFEATPTPVMNVALEQFGAFIANPDDPMPVLQRIEDASAKYWKK